MTQWVDRAKCKGMDPNVFHPQRGEPTLPATKVCYNCPVRLDCLEDAIANGHKHGIWGGCSERTRRRIRRARMLARKAGLTKPDADDATYEGA